MDAINTQIRIVATYKSNRFGTSVKCTSLNLKKIKIPWIGLHKQRYICVFGLQTYTEGD